MERRQQPAAPIPAGVRRGTARTVLVVATVAATLSGVLASPASARPAPVTTARADSRPPATATAPLANDPTAPTARDARPRAAPPAVAVPSEVGALRPDGEWQWPLSPAPAVARGFRAPPTPWSPGHRGVDLRATVGAPVLSAGDGVVAFAGTVAGRGVVTVDHSGGLRTTYEPVTAGLTAGTSVRRGQRLGVVTGQPGHCSPATCLHWGLRRGSVYLDPLVLVAWADPPVLKPVWR